MKCLVTTPDDQYGSVQKGLVRRSRRHIGKRQNYDVMTMTNYVLTQDQYYHLKLIRNEVRNVKLYGNTYPIITSIKN